MKIRSGSKRLCDRRVGQQALMQRALLIWFTGCACGSSYINEALQREVTERLKDETYLERDGIQLQHIVENEVMFSFETELKRFFDVTKDLDGHESVIIRGLKSNSEKNFGQSELNIERYFVSLFSFLSCSPEYIG